jgi:hypothetical protein
MPAPDPVHDDHRIEAHERHGFDRIETAQTSCVPGHDDDHETRHRGDRLVREHVRRDVEWGEQIAERAEQSLPARSERDRAGSSVSVHRRAMGHDPDRLRPRSAAPGSTSDSVA